MKNVMRILVADDEATIRSVIVMGLKTNGYEIREANSGAECLQAAVDFHPHLIVLDLGLGDMSGEDVLKKLRAWTSIPVLILTVTDDEATKVRLLDSGADDYLTKPFGPAELLARVRVALRHHGQTEATPLYSSGGLAIDLNQRIVAVAGAPVKLTNTEFEVLARLVRANGKVISQAQLMKDVWGPTSVLETHYLRIYINQLRKKIEKNPSSPVHIITEPGVGYRLA